MEKCVIIIVICALFCILDRTISAPIIKASGVQWSEPKGTGKGNITLIMIPQNNSCGNDSDMIVAVKSDYQIVSQDTQLLNLVVNENANNKTNASKCSTPLKQWSSLREETSNKQEILRQPNTAKYFDSENKLHSENTTNNTVNIYPLLVKNYQNLVNLNGISTTTSYNTVNLFELLNMNGSNNKYDRSNSAKISNFTNLNTTTSKYNSFNFTDPNSNILIPDNVIKSKSDDIQLPMVGSDDKFLNEALNLLETLKQNPSYYNKFISQQIAPKEEKIEQGDISLTDSKTRFFKSDDSALASDEGEGLSREFGQVNHESRDISNLEGNVNENILTSTCLPFFMSLNSEKTTIQHVDLQNPKEISFEKVPLSGTGSNVSEELIVGNHQSGSDNHVTFSSLCKPLVPNNVVETFQITKAPVESYLNVSVGYGIQSKDSQTLPDKNCKPSNGLQMQFTNISPLTVTTSESASDVGAVEIITSVSKAGPSYYLKQTLAAANIASGSEFNVTVSPNNYAVTTSIHASEFGNYNSPTKHTECDTSTTSNAVQVAPILEQANKAQSAGEMKSHYITENQVLKTSETNSSVPQLAESHDGSLSQNVQKQNELEIKSTECISRALTQSVPPPVASLNSAGNVAAGLSGLSEIKTECVTDSNVSIKLESGLPQAGVGAIPKKITLEPQVSCGTLKKEESSTLAHIEGQDTCLNDKDLTLPLVKSSIFLANNNDMPKGKDIPISLNASLDEFSLSDLQEKEDRMHEKVAELYNRNPILFNVEREPSRKIFKQQIKYCKNGMLKSPTFYFDKIYNPDSNQILKLDFSGEQKLSYKPERNNIVSNSTLENSNKLTNYEIEPGGNDNINLKPEIILITTLQNMISSKPNVSREDEQSHYTTMEVLNSHQTANDEEKLLTILNTIDQTTLGIKSKGNILLQGVSTVLPNNSMDYIPSPANDEKVLNSQESGQSNKNAGYTLGQQGNENIISQPVNLINWTTKQPNLSKKLRPKPTGRLSEKICSRPHQTNKAKTGPDFTTSGSKTAPEKKYNEKMCIPADSVQQIVIEIVRNTKKPDNKPENPDTVKVKYNNQEGVQYITGKNETVPYKDIRNIKQNFVSFQSAWKPVQIIEKQTVFPLIDYQEPNSVYSNDKYKEILKYDVDEPNGVKDKHEKNQNNHRDFENQDSFNQEKLPTAIIKDYNPFQHTATNHDKSLGANILKLLMADKSVVKGE